MTRSCQSWKQPSVENIPVSIRLAWFIHLAFTPAQKQQSDCSYIYGACNEVIPASCMESIRCLLLLAAHRSVNTCRIDSPLMANLWGWGHRDISYWTLLWNPVTLSSGLSLPRLQKEETVVHACGSSISHREERGRVNPERNTDVWNDHIGVPLSWLQKCKQCFRNFFWEMMPSDNRVQTASWKHRLLLFG